MPGFGQRACDDIARRRCADWAQARTCRLLYQNKTTRHFDYINDASDNANKVLLVKRAIEAIERENPQMEGILSKEVHGQLVPEEEP